MAAISAALVKELRDKTGAGMMDCKKALSETGGNMETFQTFVSNAARAALECGGDRDAILAASFPGAGHSFEQQLTDNIATIGENMTLRRAAALSVEPGIVAAYVHSALAPGLGKIGVLVASVLIQAMSKRGIEP